MLPRSIGWQLSVPQTEMAKIRRKAFVDVQKKNVTNCDGWEQFFTKRRRALKHKQAQDVLVSNDTKIRSVPKGWIQCGQRLRLMCVVHDSRVVKRALSIIFPVFNPPYSYFL